MANSDQPDLATLEGIERAIARLSAEDWARLHAWLEEFEGDLLDDLIERVAASSDSRGKVAGLAAETLADHEAGRSRKL
jgi:hypothetical protein